MSLHTIWIYYREICNLFNLSGLAEFLRTKLFRDCYSVVNIKCDCSVISGGHDDWIDSVRPLVHGASNLRNLRARHQTVWQRTLYKTEACRFWAYIHSFPRCANDIVFCLHGLRAPCARGLCLLTKLRSKQCL